MTERLNTPTFHATQTQRLIAAAALNSLHGDNATKPPANDQMIEDFARMMVVIQKGGMQSYFAKGTDWSFRSRAAQDPAQVAAEALSLLETVDRFHLDINTAKGKAACRIRENRAKRLKAEVKELTLQYKIGLLQAQRRANHFLKQQARFVAGPWGEDLNDAA